MEKCYACGGHATTNTTVPPLSLIPEEGEFQIDFKKHAISVPSCQKHLLSDGVSDEYFQKVIQTVPWNNVFAYFQPKPPSTSELNAGGNTETSPERIDLSKATCNLDFILLNGYISLIARAVFYHENQKVFTGNISLIIIGFTETQYHSMRMLKSCFNRLSDKYPKRGEDKQLFFHQIVPATEIFERFQSSDYYKGKGLFYRLAFYEGSEFFLIFE